MADSTGTSWCDQPWSQHGLAGPLWISPKLHTSSCMVRYLCWWLIVPLQHHTCACPAVFGVSVVLAAHQQRRAWDIAEKDTCSVGKHNVTAGIIPGKGFTVPSHQFLSLPLASSSGSLPVRSYQQDNTEKTTFQLHFSFLMKRQNKF